MATNYWIGAAAAIAQVNSYTPATITVGNTFTLTAGDSTTVTFTATGTTAANVITGLLALLNSTASPPPPAFQDVTWTDGTSVLLGTAKTAGRPFTINSSAATGAGSGTPTHTKATPTASSGPNDAGLAANWSIGAMSNSQDFVVRGNTPSILYSLDQSALTGTTLDVRPDYAGQIGLPVNSAGGYLEYKPTYLQLGAGTITYAGTGNRARIDTGSATCTVTVNNTGRSIDNGLHCLLFKGTGNTYVFNKGSVGVAEQAGETATSVASTIGNLGSPTQDCDVKFGSGVTHTAGPVMNGGTVETNSTFAVGVVNGGTLTHNAGAISTSLTNRGTLILKASAAVASYNGLGGSDVLDLTQGGNAKTLTASQFHAGSTLLDTYRKGVYTAGPILEDCTLADVTIDWGANIQLVPTFL